MSGPTGAAQFAAGDEREDHGRQNEEIYNKSSGPIADLGLPDTVVPDTTGGVMVLPNLTK